MNTTGKCKIFLIFLAFLTTGISAQTYYNDAASSYNEGIGLMKTDLEAAIQAFDKSIQISEQVGDSALAIKEKAIQLLSDSYFQIAYKLYSVEKKPVEAIQAAKTSLDIAKKHNVEKNIEKSEKFMAQLYGIMGSTSFKEKAYDNAIAYFDSALMVNPDNTSMMFNKSLVYKTQEKSELFGSTIDQFIQKATEANDTAQVSKGQKLAMEYYRVEGNKANAANKLNEALDLLNASLKYGTDKDVYYALANVYNKQKKFDEGLANAEKGLALETGAAEAKAKFYYELAVAQSGKGMTEEACNSFANAKFGTFIEASKAQMTNLKCK